MNKKTVGMISSYKAINQADWLWKQTPHPFGVWGNIQMLAQNPEPDFLLLYNFHSFPSLQPKPSRTWKSWLNGLKNQPSKQEIDIHHLLRAVPKERIISLLREPPFPEKQERRIQEYQAAQEYCGYISGPDDFAPIPEYMPAIWYVNASFRELNEMEVPEKQRLCSWITSGISRTESHRKRLAFLKLVVESDVNADIYGRGLPEWANGYGSVDDKWNVMAPYYYNLAIENYAENDLYVSEKLWDALLSWCLPIYYGGPAVDKLLPPGSFLRLPSLDEKGLAYIQEVTKTPDVWHQAKDAIAEARQIILNELNLLNFLSNLTEKLR